MIQNVLEKEARLKELVVQLLEENKLSDFELLDSLFGEIKYIKNHQLHRKSMPNLRRKKISTIDFLNFHI